MQHQGGAQPAPRRLEGAGLGAGEVQHDASAVPAVVPRGPLPLLAVREDELLGPARQDRALGGAPGRQRAGERQGRPAVLVGADRARHLPRCASAGLLLSV